MTNRRVCVCTIWTDVKLLRWLRFTFQYFHFPVCRGHGSCFPSHANEAMGFSRKGMWAHIPVPAFIFVWLGAKPRTPTTEIVVLHGCRNLRFSSTSFSTLFARYSWLYFYSHGEGLSREPYSDYSSFFGTYLMAFLVTMGISEYLPLFEWYYLGYCVSRLICIWKDSVPDGSLRRSNFV